MKKDTKEPSNKVILQTLVAMNERMDDFATKNDLAKLSEKLNDRIDDVLHEVRAVGKAVDKDAVVVIDHEKRITKIERHLSLAK